MASQLLVLAAVLGLSAAGLIPLQTAQQPLAALAVNTEYDPNPQYSYAYDVQDAVTGDSKRQQESRRGDVVHGSYSVNDPDGTRRTVDYAADPISGFNAVVRREPLARVAVATAAPVARVLQASPFALSIPTASVARVDGHRLDTALAPVALAVNQLQTASPYLTRLDGRVDGLNTLALSTNVGLTHGLAAQQLQQWQQWPQLQQLQQLQPLGLQSYGAAPRLLLA